MFEESLYKQSRSIRVFISSTFRDMMDERNLLLTRAFPSLHKHCIARGAEFTEIDLRWGITEEEAKQGRVLELCLNEIDKSRPYFIGILGDRYGWVPDGVREELYQAYPWLRNDIKRGLSVTDIEMQYGVLRDANQYGGRAFFYIKEDPADDDERLTRLKQEILSQNIHSYKYYKTAEELGGAVISDFCEVIENLFPLDEVPDEIATLRLEHFAYIKSRASIYIEPDQAFQHLDAHINSKNVPLVVTGESGTGKSALAANWLLHNEQNNPAGFKFFHFCGTNAAAAEPAVLLSRLLGELKREFDINQEIPSDLTAMRDTLSNFLACSGQKGDWVLMIDGINQLTDRDAVFTILPDEFPAFVRVILTAVGEDVVNGFHKKGFQVYELPRLSKNERAKLIEKYLSQYGKRLPIQLVESFSANALCQNPMILKAMLNELRIFGLHEGLEEQVQTLLGSTCAEEFFEQILLRLEFDFGKDYIRGFWCALLSARKGLSEQELMEMLSVTRLKLSELIGALGPHLNDGGNRLNFAHAYLKDAATRRYLGSKSLKKHAHKKLASYFTAQGESDRAIEELPYQLLHSGQKKKLKELLAHPRFFYKLLESDSLFLYAAWRSAGAAEAAYRSRIKNMSGNEKLLYAQKAGEFFMLSASYKAARYFYRQACRQCAGLYSEDSPEMALCRVRLAGVYNSLSRYTESVKNAQKAIDVLSGKKGYEAEVLESLHLFSSAHFRLGKYRDSLLVDERALELCRKVFPENHFKTAECYKAISWGYETLGDSVTAEEYAKKALNICLRLYGNNHPETADCYQDLAWMCDSLGKYTDLKAYAQNSLEICEAAFGQNHLMTGFALKQMALAAHRTGMYEKARERNERFKEIMIKIHSRNSTFASHGFFQTGLSYFMLKDYSRALAGFEASTAIEDALCGENAKNDWGVNYNYMGAAHMMLGNAEQALDYLTRAGIATKASIGEQGRDYIENRYFLGAYFERLGETGNAITHYREALGLAKKNYGETHPETGRYMYALGKLLGDAVLIESAMKIFKAAGVLHIQAEVNALLEKAY